MEQTRVFRCGVAVAALHVMADALLALEPGVSAGEHWPAVALPLAILLLAGWAYPGLRPGLRAGLGLSFGVLTLVAAGVAVAAASQEGADIDEVTGFLLFPAGIALLALGALVLWRSRRREGRIYLRRALKAVGGLVVAYWVVVPIGFAWVATHRPASAPEVAELGRPYEEIRLQASDGLELAAWYVPSENGAAVITYPSREGSVAEAAMLASHGFGVLALDARGYGESEGDPNAFGWGATADIDGAVAYLESRPDVEARIGGLGLSVGGEQMLEAAAENPDLRAVVSEGAGERSIRETLLFGPAASLTIPHQAVLTTAVAVFSGDEPPPALDDAVSGIAPGATFLIYGEQGQPGEELNIDYFEAAKEPKELWEVPGAGHTGGLDAQPAEYERRVTSFFERHLADRQARASGP
jgi:uncharacterized protein